MPDIEIPTPEGSEQGPPGEIVGSVAMGRQVPNERTRLADEVARLVELIYDARVTGRTVHNRADRIHCRGDNGIGFTLSVTGFRRDGS